MIDLEEHKRIAAQAEAEAERLLGSKPGFNAPQSSILLGVVVYMILTLFSAVTGTYETSRTVILIFVVVIAGGSYWYQRHRETRWIKTTNEIEMRLRGQKRD